MNLTTPELAKRWKLSEGTLRNWRYLGVGPAYCGRPVRYKLIDVKRWEKENTVQPRKPRRQRRSLRKLRRH